MDTNCHLLSSICSILIASHKQLVIDQHNKMASKSKSLKNLDFNCISPQTLNYMDEDFKYN